jgi:hypothetical protein
VHLFLKAAKLCVLGEYHLLAMKHDGGKATLVLQVLAGGTGQRYINFQSFAQTRRGHAFHLGYFAQKSSPGLLVE